MPGTNGRHLVVGLAPGPGRDATRRVLDSPSGRRLAALAGTTLQDVLDRCETMNAYVTGDESRADANRHLREVLGSASWTTVMLVGFETCAFINQRPPFVLGTMFGLPHTSGLSRWWNDPVNVRRGRRVARAWWSTVDKFSRIG